MFIYGNFSDTYKRLVFFQWPALDPATLLCSKSIFNCHIVKFRSPGQVIEHCMAFLFRYFRLGQVHQHHMPLRQDLVLPAILPELFCLSHQAQLHKYWIGQLIGVGQAYQHNRLFSLELPVPVYCFISIK